MVTGVTLKSSHFSTGLPDPVIEVSMSGPEYGQMTWWQIRREELP